MKTLTLSDHGTSLEVTRLVLGTDKMPDLLSESEIFELFDQYVDAGGNCLDTARVYCGGQCEELVGRWIKGRGCRSRVLISTKGCHPPKEDMTKPRLTRADMRNDIEASLKAMQTDHADLYWLHRDDPDTPAEQIIEDLNSFVKEGKIRLIGCSNWRSERVEQANRYAEQAGLCKFVSNQIQWSLAETREEIYQDVGIVIMNRSEYDYYLSHKMPVFAYASQAQGFFPIVAQSGLDALPPKVRARFASEDNLLRLERAKKIAAERNVPVPAVVLNYIISNRLPAAALIGPKAPDQLADSLRAAELEVTPEEMDALFQI